MTGETVYINDQELGQTNNAGALRFEPPNEEEITVSTDYSGIDSEEFEVEGTAETVTEIEASFQEDLKQGQENTLTVEGNGEPLQNAEIYANEIQKGETNTDGELKFEIPETDTITIYIEEDDTEFEEDFNTEILIIDITWFGPDDGEEIDDYEVEFDFNTELQESGTATLEIEDETQIEEDLDEGSTRITEEITFEEADTRNYELEIQTDSETRTQTGEITNTEDRPDVDIVVKNPEEQTIEENRINFEYEINSPVDYKFDLAVNDESVDGFQQSSGENQFETQVSCLEEGDLDYEISVYDQDENKIKSKDDNLEITTPQPIGHLNIVSPEDKTYEMNNIWFEHEVYACQDSLDYSVILDDDVIDSDAVSEGSNFPYFEDELDSGNYETWVEAGDGEIQSEIVEFGVE